MAQQLNIYTFTGRDGSSDIGSWQVTIIDYALSAAKAQLRRHLKQMGRDPKSEYKVDNAIVLPTAPTLLSSTVESRQ